MASEPGITEQRLSPLDQIRQYEAESTRRIAAAHQTAEERVAHARGEAARIKRAARESGFSQGKKEYQEIVSAAETEAQAMVSQAHTQAEDLLQRGKRRCQDAVRKAVDILLGFEAGDER
jgi:vacuolar-type H+-ATPase subunit H